MLRIISGKYKGYKLAAPKGAGTRPTLEKTREIIFDILSSRFKLEAFEAIDLFAGSGALGIEALSRGVCKVLFVEINRSNCRLIQKNIEKLDAMSQCSVWKNDALKWIQLRDWSSFPKLFFLDPPYDSALAQRTVDLITAPQVSLEKSLLVLETNKEKTITYRNNVKLFRQKVVGNTRLDFLMILSNESS